MTEAPPYFVAMEQVYPAVTSSAVLALLRGAERARLVRAWLDGGGPVPDDPFSRAVQEALSACGVLVEQAGSRRFAPVWQALMSESALISPADLLGRFAVEARLLEALGQGLDYWSLGETDRLTYARGISPDPANPAVVAMLSGGALGDPDLEALRGGGTLLELGCGVAGRTLALLQGIPDFRVVGVELADDLAAEAVRRAERLGVSDRFEVVVADATTFRRSGAFDVAFWSQFFFPARSRPGALEVLFDSLRPGGVVQAPLAGDFASMRADPDGGQARYYTLTRVVHESWGVPERTPEQLTAELERAGFVDVEVRGGGAAGPQRARGVRP